MIRTCFIWYSQDEFKYKGKSVYPLDRMVIQRTAKKGWSSDWFVHWVSLIKLFQKYRNMPGDMPTLFYKKSTFWS